MGMRPARFFAPIFLSNDPNSPNTLLSVMMLRGMLEGLVRANEAYLYVFPDTPSIYAQNVAVTGHKFPFLFKGARYTPELKSEDWLTLPYILANGGGDCEDLASADTAQRRMARFIAHYKATGKRDPRLIDRSAATADIRARYLPTIKAWRAHAITKLPGNKVFDPSKALGMPTGGLPETWGRGV